MSTFILQVVAFAVMAALVFLAVRWIGRDRNPVEAEHRVSPSQKSRDDNVAGERNAPDPGEPRGRTT
ncbi:MAG: hypothetical protein ABI794_09010 [Betaproteobacteria bacterium]